MKFFSAGSYDGCGQSETINTTWNQDIDPISGLVASPWNTRFLPYLQWTTQPGDVYTLFVYDVGHGITHAAYTDIKGNDISTAKVIFHIQSDKDACSYKHKCGTN